jgi:hypothetical protein
MEKTIEQYTEEAKRELEPLLKAAETSPGVLEALAIMEGYERSNVGSEEYAAFIEGQVYLSATNTAV